MDLKNRKLLVCYGGGINSTAMLERFSDGGVIPGLILFSDTGDGNARPGERPDTYSFIEEFSERLKRKGLPAIITVRKGGEDETLYERCLRRGELPSLAYGFRSCSEKYKIRAMNVFCNHFPPFIQEWKAGAKVVKAIGFDAGEPHRAKESPDPKYENWYPLIEWGWDRDDCQAYLQERGLKPGKSSCFFCPAMKKPEIIQLRKEHPQLLKKALAMEDVALTNLTSVKGLGRRYSWKEFLLEYDANHETCQTGAEIEEPCGCYDG